VCPVRQYASESTMKKPKTVPYRLIEPDTKDGLRLHTWLRELLATHHQDVQGARFALAWHVNWKPDDDGHLTLGQCRKSSDLDREIQNASRYDFVILLNQNFYEDPLVSDTQRRAVLDHELCHAGVKLGDDGAPVIDERGRIQYRIRKHDLEEFSTIAERYGCWKRDIEAFAKSLARARQDDQWIGFSGLQAQLLAVGVPIPIEAIRHWSEGERREASIWVSLFKAAGPGATIEASCPPHILSALHANPPDRSARPS
jgi:Putative phage metallopeptidase